MNRLKRSLLTAMLTPMFTVLLLVPGAVRAASLPCGAVSVAASPNIRTNSNLLASVAGISANDLWSVGNYVNDTVFPVVIQTLTEHWDGSSWRVVTSPNIVLNNTNNYLSGVAPVSASDVWAVGFSRDGNTSLAQTLIEHWDGTSWSIVSSPDIGPFSNYLSSVAAVSASDIWAVGHYTASNRVIQTLVEHWNGANWSVVSSPNPDQFANVLNSVTVVSASNVWAVGTRNAGTLTEQWNGANWSVVPSPNSGSGNNYLYGVAAASANDIWAVGFRQDASKVLQTLTEQWNGTSWKVVSSPNVAPGQNYLYGVATISANNIWAVGHAFNTRTGFQHTLIEQWNGTSWSIVSSPNPGTQFNELNGATVVANNLWSVGDSTNTSANQRTLIEFHC